MTKQMHGTLIGLGLAVALTACQGQAPAAVTPGRLTLHAAVAPGPSINWAALRLAPELRVPRRAIQDFGSPGLFHAGPVAANPSTLGNGYLAGGLIPYYSSGNLAETPGTYLADPIGHTVYQLPAFGPNVLPIGLSRGGGLIGISSNGQLGILDPRSQLIQTFPQLDSQYITSSDVDAYGDIAYIDASGQVHLFNPQTGKDYIVPAASRGLAGVGNISISGNGRLLSYNGLGPTGPNIYTTDLSSGQQLSSGFLNTTVPGGAQSLQLSADGSSLLFSQYGQLRVLDYHTGLIDNLALLNDGLPVFDAAFVGNGTAQIVFTRAGRLQVYDRRTHLIDTMPYANQVGNFSLFGAPGSVHFGGLF